MVEIRHFMKIRHLGPSSAGITHGQTYNPAQIAAPFYSGSSTRVPEKKTTLVKILTLQGHDGPKHCF